LGWSIKQKTLIKKKAKLKLRRFSFTDRQQRTNKYPTWIGKFKESFGDVIKYVEVDYLTLSIFIVYEPFLWNDFSTYNFITDKKSVLYMHNWKYVT
jgi:hypothetical protein